MAFRPDSWPEPSGHHRGSVLEATWRRPESPGDNFRACG